MQEHVKEMVESIKERMEIPDQEVEERLPGSGFVATRPLTQDSGIAFTHKMVSTRTPHTENVSNRPSQGTPFSVSRSVQLTPQEETALGLKQNTEETTPNVQQFPVPTIPGIEILTKAISKVSNSIKEYLNIEDIFNIVKMDIRDKKMSPELFYQRTQNCIYHTLREFCGITVVDGADKMPESPETLECLPTLYFFGRIGDNKPLFYEKHPAKIMVKYRKMFGNTYDGIQEAWLSKARSRMKEKLPVDDSVIQTVIESIQKVWTFVPDVIAEPEIPPVIPEDTVNAEFEQELPTSDQDLTPDNTPVISEEDPEETYDHFYDVYSKRDASEHEVPSTTVLQRPSDEEGEYPYGVADAFENPLVVDIEYQNGFYVVSIMTHVDSTIPFYIPDMNQVPIDREIPSVVDDGNGIWDWLIHFQPHLMFVTMEPEKYLNFNDDEKLTHIKCVIMDENDGLYTMGVYIVDEELGNTEDGNDTLVRQINYLVKDNIAHTPMSHLNKSLNMTELFIDENNVISNMSELSIESDDDEEEDERTFNEDDEDSMAAKAAVESMMGTYADRLDEDSKAYEGEYPDGVLADDGMDQSITTIGNKSKSDEDSVFKVRHRKVNYRRD